MDIVLITDGTRPHLFDQTVRSMVENAADWRQHRLVVVVDDDDDSQAGGRKLGRDTRGSLGAAGATIIYTSKRSGVGGAKNYGAEWLHTHPDVDYPPLQRLLMFSDDDMYYLPRWDERLSDPMIAHAPTQLGGWRHPYHMIKGPHTWRDNWRHSEESAIVRDIPQMRAAGDVWLVDAVTGNCFVMRWSDWLKYGPFDANALGPGQSEDYALSQKIIAAGGVVATLEPRVAIHCGLVNSAGQPATGWEECEKLVQEQMDRDVPAGVQVLVDVPPPQPAPRSAFSGLRITPDTVMPEGVKPPDHPVEVVASRYAPGTTIEDRVQQYISDESLRPLAQPVRLNIGSGQRRFDMAHRWINVDAQSQPPDRVPDLVCDVGREQLPFTDGSVEMIVLHQVLEHNGCGQSLDVLRECWRVLAPRGSIIITVPDIRKLAARYLGGELSEQVFLTNVYGAYMGDEADRHKWGGSYVGWQQQLVAYMMTIASGAEFLVDDFNFRYIPGADIAEDWWIAGYEIVKE